MNRWLAFLPGLLAVVAGASPLHGAPAAGIDPDRLIAASSSPLEEAEPAMSPAEQAVHAKVTPILAKRPEFALKLLRSMAGTSPDGEDRPSPAFEFMLGNAFYAVDDLATAEAKYRSAVERSPDFVRAWNNLGVLYYVQDRFADAVPCFSRAVALGDRDPTTFGLFGTSLEKTGNTVSAEMAYMQALAGDPTDIHWTEGLLRLYFADKQFSKAQTLVQALLRAHPHEAKYHLTRVNLHLAMRRKLEAIAGLQQMCDTDLARDEDVGLLADLYAEQSMIPEALAALDRLARSLPELAEQKRLRLARALIANRAWSRTDAVLESVELGPLSASGRIIYLETRVELELARKDWVEAKNALGTLLAEAPDNGNAWLGLGRVHLAETEEAEAVAAFERARAIPGSAYRASLELANLACKHGRYPECLRHLDHALAIQRTPAVETFRNEIRKLTAPETQTIR